MGEAFDEAIEDVISQLGLGDTAAASSAARSSYELHARLLTAWGAAINLTAIREPTAIAVRHVGDALTAIPALLAHGATTRSLLDIGSGGGYPGLPLAAALGPSRVDLVDSVGKKARFLGVAAAAVTSALRSEHAAPLVIEAVAERAEEIAEEPKRRETWEVVTARAVGPLSEVMELALPLTRIGGTVVAWKRDGDGTDLLAELRDAGHIIRVAGGGRPDVAKVPGDLFAKSRLVLVNKERPSPSGYPRPAGVRKRGRR
jgi:16S rRNA (guanine527-N7)-methyltransferase